MSADVPMTTDDSVPLNGLDRLRRLLNLPGSYAQEVCSAAADKIEQLREALEAVQSEILLDGQIAEIVEDALS